MDVNSLVKHRGSEGGLGFSWVGMWLEGLDPGLSGSAPHDHYESECGGCTIQLYG